MELLQFGAPVFPSHFTTGFHSISSPRPLAAFVRLPKRGPKETFGRRASLTNVAQRIAYRDSVAHAHSRPKLKRPGHEMATVSPECLAKCCLDSVAVFRQPAFWRIFLSTSEMSGRSETGIDNARLVSPLVVGGGCGWWCCYCRCCFCSMMVDVSW